MSSGHLVPGIRGTLSSRKDENLPINLPATIGRDRFGTESPQLLEGWPSLQERLDFIHLKTIDVDQKSLTEMSSKSSKGVVPLSSVTRPPTKQHGEVSDSGYGSVQLNSTTTPSSKCIRSPPDVTQVIGSPVPKLDNPEIHMHRIESTFEEVFLPVTTVFATDRPPPGGWNGIFPQGCIIPPGFSSPSPDDLPPPANAYHSIPVVSSYLEPVAATNQRRYTTYSNEVMAPQNAHTGMSELSGELLNYSMEPCD